MPPTVRADPDAAKGTGVAELEGSEPVFYEAYYATTGEYAATLNGLDVPTTDAPAPTVEQIALHSPVL